MTELTSADRLVPIHVYGRPGCMQCKQTTRKLDKHGVPYTYVDVDDDAVAGALVDIYATKNPGPKSLPLVTAGDQYWFGFRHERLARLIDIHHTSPDISSLDAVAAQYLEEVGNA